MPEAVPPEDPCVMVFQYAVHGDLPEAAVAELRRAHDLRNGLLDIEEQYQEAVAAVWARFPHLDELVRQIEADEEVVAELVEQAKKERMRKRSTAVGAELRERTKVARATLKEHKAALREAKERSFEAAKPGFHQAAEDRHRAIKALYRTVVDEGLYWASYNDVLAHHRTAVKSISKLREQGRPAGLRRRPWRGEGSIAVQLQYQRSSGQPPPTPAVVADEERSPWRNVAVISPAVDPEEFAQLRGRARRPRNGKLRFRIGSNETEAQIEVPLLIHRPLPADAEIKMVRISRRLVAGRAKVEASVTVRVPSGPLRTEGSVVAMHCGWRSLGDGTVRVAVVTGVKEPPAELSRVVRWHGDWGEIVTEGRNGQHRGWANTLVRCSEVRSVRDQMLDRLREDVVAWLGDHGNALHRGEPLTAATVSRWRSPRRFVFLLRDWNEEPPDDAEQLLDRLCQWEGQDLHLWRWEAHERNQILGDRSDAWRKVGAWLCKDAALLMVDGWDADIFRMIPLPEDEDPHQMRRARVNRTIAAPGSLRHAVRNAAERQGVRVHEVERKVSLEHHGCGGVLGGEDRREAILVPCPRCGHMVDQDYSALGHLLDASASMPDE